MLINYWDCKYCDYDETWDGVEEIRYYTCTYPSGTGTCNLDNKYGGERDDCKLLD